MKGKGESSLKLLCTTYGGCLYSLFFTRLHHARKRDEAGEVSGGKFNNG